MKNLLIIILTVIGNVPINGQYKDVKILAESVSDPYIFIPRASYKTSPAYKFSDSKITTIQVNVNDLGENMIGDAANEPSFAISPVDPKHMIIGWRQFGTITNNFREAGYAYTTDGGSKWLFPAPIEAGKFRSDPVLDVDAFGNFYYNSLSVVNNNYPCHVFKFKEDNTWDNGTYAYGGDKQWMVIDKSSEEIGNIYALWRSDISECAPKGFTRSRDNGMAYEPCTELPETMGRGTLAIGSEGELYICGDLGIQYVMAKASKPGKDDPFVWDHLTNVNLGGHLSYYHGPNPAGLLGQVWIATDISSGPNRGNVYLLSTIENYTSGDKADIAFSRSTDGGLTWSEPIVINDDKSIDNWQYFGSISVAPNGRIDVSWVDTRDNPNTYNSRLYFSYSTDGGLTWSKNEGLSEAFDPHLGFPNQNKIGDYYHMISDSSSAHLAWAATFNGEEDVYYSRIDLDLSSNNVDIDKSDLVKIYPNPSDSYFNIQMPAPYSNVDLTVYNSMGQSIFHQKMINTQDFRLDLNNYPSGVYEVQFRSKDIHIAKRIVLR